eukprot:1556473-Prymnesium_polylepis.1
MACTKRARRFEAEFVAGASGTAITWGSTKALEALEAVGGVGGMEALRVAPSEGQRRRHGRRWEEVSREP